MKEARNDPVSLADWDVEVFSEVAVVSRRVDLANQAADPYLGS